MGVVIEGPWGKEPKVPAQKEVTVSECDGTDAVYPWYALSGPKGTTPAERNKMLTSLRKLARACNRSGATMQLPTGWYWDPVRVQSIINELNRITDQEEPEEIPDDIA